jgi:hypothetical protein
MHTSVTSGLANSGSSARRVRRRADTSLGLDVRGGSAAAGAAGAAGATDGAAGLGAAGLGAAELGTARLDIDVSVGFRVGMLTSTPRCNCSELINRPEVEIAGHEDLDPVTVSLGNRRWDVYRILQNIRHHAFGRRRVVNNRPTPAAR